MTEDRFVSPESPPEGLERELLTVLAEECAEVQQRIFKILRFGLTEVQPGQEYDNSQRLAHEVGDIIATSEKLIQENILNVEDIYEGKVAKHNKLGTFLQNQGN